MEEVSKNNIRYNGTVRTPYKSEFKECFRCKKTKDVIEFTAFYHQRKKDGVKVGDPIRKRLGHCKSCAVKKGESVVNKYVFEDSHFENGDCVENNSDSSCGADVNQTR